MRVKFLLLGVLIGLIVFVLAAAPVWIGSTVDYMIKEDVVYYHDLRVNITGYSSDVDFAIDTDQQINWTNASGTFAVDAFVVSDWLNIYDASSGNLTINAQFDNQSGFFIVPIQATNTTDDEFAGTNFEFQINATNDAPIFLNLNYSYIFPSNPSGGYTINASDEEEHYPLVFNLTFINNCTHAAWSNRIDGENCSVFNLTYDSNVSTVFDFEPTSEDVGVYWANFSVTDFNGSCPHDYCDASSYNMNQSSQVYLLKFDAYGSLSVDVSNCTGANLLEGEQFNCSIEVRTQGSDDDLNFSSYGFFSSNPATPYDSSHRDWFYADSSNTSSNYVYDVPISINPTKKEVGNWTINFTALDVSRAISDLDQIEVYVYFVESSVLLDSVSDIILYENESFILNASDDDLLIWDSSIKLESLTFSSNASWVSVTSPSVSSHNNNYLSSLVSVDHSYVLNNFGAGNYTVNISVVDSVGNLDWDVFVVEVLNESAPVWNSSLSDPVVLELVEGENFSYNVSMNVSDAENDSISFYYEVPEEFCSLDGVSFNSSSGVINFTPVDCDVGYHNMTIVATDGMKNSTWSFNFSISNVVDSPVLNTLSGYNSSGQFNLAEGFNFVVKEGVPINFSLIIDDDDLLIPEGQKNYYNESLIVDVSFVNSTGSSVDLFNFSFLEFFNPNPESASYGATFVALISDIGNYSVFVNVVDSSGNSTNRTWFLNVTESLEAPVLQQVDNVSLTLYDYLNFSLNASDNEDDYNGLDLNYSVSRLDSDAPNLSVVGNKVEFNMSSNSSYEGSWGYNITVNDSDGMVDSQIFWVFVYGPLDLVSPVEGVVFNLTENVSSVLNFTVNHSIGDELVYDFWIDSISCLYNDSVNCSYGNFSLRERFLFLGNGSVFEWDFLPNFRDETYGHYKNLTVSIYSNSSFLTSEQKDLVASNFSFKLNISHANAPIRATNVIPLLQTDYNSNINLDLNNFFEDEDVDDPYYVQNISFVKSGGNADISLSHAGGWYVVIGTIVNSAFSGLIDIVGSDGLSSAGINDTIVDFIEPEVINTPQPDSGAKGTSTKLKFFSLRIIVPEEVIISDENYIEIPFGLENSGAVDLKGIDLSTTVLYNNEFSSDVRIELGDTYIDELLSGEKREYTMKIFADTDRSGKYKATVFANVTSPHFSDWADFFIDLRRTNESEAEELLIFTEKLLLDNPECLELTEVLRRAQESFAGGEVDEAMRLATEVSEACEDAILSNEQIRYQLEGFVERNFYYISFLTLIIFFMGFVFYVYKRVKFNKSVEGDYYVRGD
jgi:hypothetical protein